MGELLAMFGTMAKELFDYNQDVYKFDQQQRLERDLLRLELQVKRFELLREDVRDMVDLTVGKMETYHLVGALFLEFCVAFYAEGKIETVFVPPFALSLYYLSVAGAFLHLALAVWLSMHASISAHSFGVRLLTRYVRLPIPGAKQMNALNAHLADFERERKGMLRIPFIQQGVQWQEQGSGGAEALRGSYSRAESASAAASSSSSRPPMRTTVDGAFAGGVDPNTDFLGAGEVPYEGGEELVTKAAPKGWLANEHVRLFRQLQAKWQCFDAYARVAMSLGASELLQSVSFFLVTITMVEYRTPVAAYALVFIFQGTSLALAFLDIAGLGRRSILLVQAVGAMPCILACVALTAADFREEKGALLQLQGYPLSPLCFFLMAAYIECLLHIAWPSRDEFKLPRRFRSVLFLDVFGDLSYDPQSAEKEAAMPSVDRRFSDDVRSIHVRNAELSDDACRVAHEALRRWETLPSIPALAAPFAELSKLRKELTVWRRALSAEVSGMADQTDRDDGLFKGRLLGPFQEPGERCGTHYYFDPDSHSFTVNLPADRQLLTLQEAAALAADAQASVRSLISERRAPLSDDRSQSYRRARDSDSDGSSREGSLSRGHDRISPVGPKVPQRLPWRVLLCSTRALQAAWLFQGFVFALQEMDVVRLDYPHLQKVGTRASDRLGEGEGADVTTKISEEYRRRLGDTAPVGAAINLWHFSEVSVDWPGGSFFRLDGGLSYIVRGVASHGRDELRCSTTTGCGTGVVMLGSAYEVYSADLIHRVEGAARESRAAFPQRQHEPFKLQPLREPSTSPGTVALCGPQSSRVLGKGCIMATLRKPDCVNVGRGNGDGTISLRSFGNESVEFNLRIEARRSWLLFGGAQLRCGDVADMVVETSDEEVDAKTGDGAVSPSRSKNAVPSTWCLVMVGWDGGDRLHVGAVPLSGHIGSLPWAGSELVPVFALPLHSSGKHGVAALHLEAQSGRGRLWALLTDYTMLAWELVHPRSIGRWQLLRAFGKRFQATGICEDTISGQMLVAGRDEGGRSRIFQANLSAVSAGFPELPGA
eukprot:TRINITY_DN2430_c0_g1_i1.p1 TRINITY_DN2430_c0_g1~~TRINITY_DN2430_c0_g1_i1.p1  ORF type:complete len:1052 (-),score=145.33 TRINITY_DN2430_c0_g1_i1:175-3330(-)